MTITDISKFSGYILNIKRDDDAIVYINGAEVFRTNMPNGTINLKTEALTESGGSSPITATLPPGVFFNGANIIAVEVHQNSP